MSLLSSVADGPVLDALASALLHFVWQGAVLALLLAMWFRRVGPRSNARYVAGVVTLAAMLAAPVATFTWIAMRQGVRSIDVAPEARTTPAPVARATDTTLREVEPEPVAPTAASALLGRIAPAAEAGMLAIWFAGVAALSLRLLGGWAVARRLATQAVRPASAELRTLATQIAGRLALDRAVSILESSRVRVPVIVGWLKPVVLFPAATLSSLSPSQIEAILAHELAHIRRHDYLVNLLQSAVETLLFYHPAVWWASRHVRAEREHCCDDVAVEVCDRLVYVSALSDLARMTTAHGTALAATDGSLVRRVRRLLGADSGASADRPGSFAVLTLIVLGAVALPAALTSREVTPPPPASSPDPRLIAAVAAPMTNPNPTGSGNFAVVQPSRSAEAAVPPSPPDTGEAQTAADLEKKIRAEQELKRKQIEAVEAELWQLALARRQVEHTQIENEGQARLAELTVELEALRKQRARAADMVAVGTLSSTALMDLEKQLAVMELKLRSARSDLEVRRSDANLRKREEELRRQYELQTAEYAKALAEQQPWKSKGWRPTEDTAVYSRLDRMSREEWTMAISVEITSPTETIRVDDILIIEIQGEPDLPRAYVVQADGTIRLPLAGTLTVQKLTAAQAKEGVQKLLAKYRLEAATAVSVQLRRPR